MVDSKEKTYTPGSDVPFKSRRGRPTAEQAEAITRTIMDAAAEAFLSKGYDVASMEAIAQKAGIPKSTLYKRFRDKKTLLRAVYLDRFERWSSPSSQSNRKLSDNIEERLKQRLYTVAKWAAADEVRAFTSLALGVGEGATTAMELMQQIGYNAVVKDLEQDIREYGNPEGKPIKDPKSVALALMSMLTGWVATKPHHKPISQNQARAFINRSIELIINGKVAW